MIIDCDTHFMPRNAFDYVGKEFLDRKPILKFDETGILTDVAFPGEPPRVRGTTPLPPPGSGAQYPGNSDMELRLAEYERMGIGPQFILPQFTGWWSYLIDPSLANALAHSWNLSMLRLMREYPTTIYGVALVALQDVPGAIREMEWAKENNFPAVVLITPIRFVNIRTARRWAVTESFGRSLKGPRSWRCRSISTLFSMATGSSISWSSSTTA